MWPLRALGRTPAFAYIAARTRFYDDHIAAALGAGVRQVVVLAAGYDSRSWRLAAPGVRFFEVDLPSTQADKRARAPAGGPTFVPVDAGDDPGDALITAGLVVGEPTMFTVEGLTMYLREAEVIALLTTLAELGGARSRLAIDFAVGTRDEVAGPALRAAQAVTRSAGKLSREPLRYELEPHKTSDVLGRTGWHSDDVLSGKKLADAYLVGTGMPTPRDRPGAYVAAATLL